MKKDDILKHYGVKGMKWDDQKKSIDDLIKERDKSFNDIKNNLDKIGADIDRKKAQANINPLTGKLKKPAKTPKAKPQGFIGPKTSQQRLEENLAKMKSMGATSHLGMLKYILSGGKDQTPKPKKQKTAGPPSPQTQKLAEALMKAVNNKQSKNPKAPLKTQVQTVKKVALERIKETNKALQPVKKEVSKALEPTKKVVTDTVTEGKKALKKVFKKLFG